MTQLNEIPREHRIAELWRRGELSYLLHEGQRKIKTAFSLCKAVLFAALVSRQFGKTVWACTEAIETAIKQPKARIRYGTAFLTDLEEFLIPAFEFVLQDCPEHLRPVYKHKGSKYVFPNGSEIKLVGLDKKPNGLRGSKLALIIIDEAGFVSRLLYLYRSVITPTLTHSPGARVILITTPPESPVHEFNELFDLTKLQGSTIELDVYQCPILTPARIEELKKECGGENSADWQREYLIKRIVDLTKAIVPEWLEAKASCVEPLKYTPTIRYCERFSGLDIGVVHKTGVLHAVYDFTKAKLHILAERTIKGHEVTSQTVYDLVDTAEKQSKSDDQTSPLYTVAKTFRVADNNNLILLNDLAKLGLPFIATDKEKLHEMVNEVRLWVRAKRLVVDPGCKELLGCLESAIWNDKRTEFATSKVYGHFDLLAALVYLVRFVAQRQHVNPIPAHIGASQDVLVINKKPKNHEIKRLFGGR